MPEMIRVENLHKTFTLHLRGGARLPVLSGFDLSVEAGECVALLGSSGTGKSTLMRCLYGNYRPQAGRVLIRHDGAMVDLVGAAPRLIVELRRRTMGYVSQFLRVIPRLSTLDIVMEPLLTLGVAEDEARRRAGDMLARLNIPQRLWALPPATFSGGEQQRVNIARVFVARQPVILLDEPTASLDDDNRRVVIELIDTARKAGAAMVAIMHDVPSRAAVATRTVEMPKLEMAA